MSKLLVDEIFTSIQGEGVNLGRRAMFIRCHGCNLKCSRAEQGFDCDTPQPTEPRLELSPMLVAQTIIGKQVDWVVFTGGEPMLQYSTIHDTIKRLGVNKPLIAIETNGTIELPNCTRTPFDWVTCSPKVGHLIHQSNLMGRVDEVKVVWASVASMPVIVPEPKSNARWLMPAWPFEESTIESAVQYIKTHPYWRLGIQAHKFWRVS